MYVYFILIYLTYLSSVQFEYNLVTDICIHGSVYHWAKV
jgi:hypothetical protein